MANPLPTMYALADDPDLMICGHCGQVMGKRLLLQIAHSNFCPPPEPPTGPKADPDSEAPPAT